MKHDWEYKKLGEIGTFQRGSGLSKKDLIEDGFPCILYGQIHTRFGVSTDKHLTCIPQELVSTAKIAHSGDLILAITSEDVEGSCKSTAWLGDYDIAVGSDIAIFHHQQNAKFIAYYTKTKDFFNKKSRYARGFKVTHISTKEIETIPIPVPPLPIQQQIVAELDKVSEIIEKKKQQVKELDNLAQSIFYDMFGDPVENEKGWEVKKLGEIGELSRGVSKHRPRNAPELLDGTMPLIQTGDVSNSGMYITEYHSTYSDLGVKQSRIWGKGTLCITIAANIGKCSILTFEACFPDSVVGFIPSKDTCTEYMYFVFGSIQKSLEDNAMGVAQKNINLGILNQISLALPPLSLQQAFAEKVEAIEKQKELITASLKEAETLFDARMEYWFGE